MELIDRFAVFWDRDVGGRIHAPPALPADRSWQRRVHAEDPCRRRWTRPAVRSRDRNQAEVAGFHAERLTAEVDQSLALEHVERLLERMQVTFDGRTSPELDQ